jgi:hypothetical protein
MNGIRIITLIGAFLLSALIVWHDLPIEFPGTIAKVLLLFLKLSAVLAVTIFVYIFAGRRRKSS